MNCSRASIFKKAQYQPHSTELLRQYLKYVNFLVYFQFDVRNVTQTEVMADAIQIINCVDMVSNCREQTNDEVDGIQSAIQRIVILRLRAISVLFSTLFYFQYFRQLLTRVSIVYIETWQGGDQIEKSTDIKQTLISFLDYSSKNLYQQHSDARHLLTYVKIPTHSYTTL